MQGVLSSFQYLTIVHILFAKRFDWFDFQEGTCLFDSNSTLKIPSAGFKSLHVFFM